MVVTINSAHLALAELESDIACSLRVSEVTKQPNIRLLSSQPQVFWEMRPQLLEFLAQAQAVLELLPETLALGVSILDRYMSKRIVYARHYQLLGCVCLWLAAKTVDDKHRVPTTGTLSYLCADAYAESMFREMELHVLSTLEWDIIAPTAQDFVDFSVAEVARRMGGETFTLDDYTVVRCMARYAAECSMFVKSTVAIKPSVVAATSVALASTVLDVIQSRGWSPIFPKGSSKECFDALVAILANPPSECAARYSTDDQCQASIIYGEFFNMLANNSHYGRMSGGNTPLYGSQFNYDEPCTPVRSRQVSLDSCGTFTPTDCELPSPDETASSPASYFVPLTPDDVYGLAVESVSNLGKTKQL